MCLRLVFTNVGINIENVKIVIDALNIDIIFSGVHYDIRRFQSHPSGAFGTSDK